MRRRVGDTDEIAALLISELRATQTRIHEWVKAPDFVPPIQPSVPDPTFKTWPRTYVTQIVGLFLARLSWNANAIHLLSDQGLAVQAQPILRAALESTIDLRYISTNPQTLVTKWCLFEEIQRYRFWISRPEDERPPDYGLGEREVARRLKQLDRHRPRQGGKKWTLAMLAKDWDQTNLAERDEAACTALNTPDAGIYCIYKLLCGNLHGGTEAANDFVVAHGDGKFQVVPGIEGRKRVFVPFFALYSLDVSIDAARRCGAYMDEAVGPRWDEFAFTPKQLSDAAIEDFSFAMI